MRDKVTLFITNCKLFVRTRIFFRILLQMGINVVH